MALAIDRSLRLPESHYIPGTHKKTGIAIHHTVGGSARSTFEFWRRDKANGKPRTLELVEDNVPRAPDALERAGRPRLVGTAYIVDTDGTVYDLFDPTAWAYQFGLPWTAKQRIAFEQRFIGIELASEGGLIEHKGALYCFDRVSRRTRKARDQAFDYGRPYRGYRWFDRYEERQLESLGLLVDSLCERFAIPRVYPAPPFDFHGELLADFEGVIGHAMVRADKSDPAPDPWLWQTLRDLAQLKEWNVIPWPWVGTGRALTTRRIETLFAENMRRINVMDTAAGSLIKALLMELERRNTYLELGEPAPGAHAVAYTLAQGSVDDVRRVAKALGLVLGPNGRLEVRHA
jgi:hypothetical protein